MIKYCVLQPSLEYWWGKRLSWEMREILLINSNPMSGYTVPLPFSFDPIWLLLLMHQHFICNHNRFICKLRKKYQFHSVHMFSIYCWLFLTERKGLHSYIKRRSPKLPNEIPYQWGLSWPHFKNVEAPECLIPLPCCVLQRAYQMFTFYRMHVPLSSLSTHWHVSSGSATIFI